MPGPESRNEEIGLVRKRVLTFRDAVRGAGLTCDPAFPNSELLIKKKNWPNPLKTVLALLTSLFSLRCSVSEVPPEVPADNRIQFYHRDRDHFGFLSNFHIAPIEVEGEAWATSEHYYQAQKSRRAAFQAAVRAAVSPGHAKRLGADPGLPKNRSGQSWFRTNGVPKRADWQDVKLEVMRIAVRAKFLQNSELGQKLLATGTSELIEDSTGDEFWGCGKKGAGQNWLGRVLMEVRAELQQSLPSIGDKSPDAGARFSHSGDPPSEGRVDESRHRAILRVL